MSVPSNTGPVDFSAMPPDPFKSAPRGKMISCGATVYRIRVESGCSQLMAYFVIAVLAVKARQCRLKLEQRHAAMKGFSLLQTRLVRHVLRAIMPYEQPALVGSAHEALDLLLLGAFDQPMSFRYTQKVCYSPCREFMARLLWLGDECRLDAVRLKTL